MRATLVAVRLGEPQGLGEEELTDVYYLFASGVGRLYG
jgi:hypothetical protein